MKIVIAPDSFKESLAARDVCDAIARGVRRALPDAEIDTIPLADGGEGTVDALVNATGGRFYETEVVGPLGRPVSARWGTIGREGKTAVIEMAAASGLALVPPNDRNPELTTTYGTGQLILAALDAGATEIILGIGGSATNDGGTGAAQAVGVRFWGPNERQMSGQLSCRKLLDVRSIDVNTRDTRISSLKMRVACDVDNPLCGPNGAAYVYATQKGASKTQIPRLDRALGHLADLIQRDLKQHVRNIPGAGAAGGLGAGLIAFFGARLEPGIDVVTETVRLAERVGGADLVITGEGRIDGQSMMGKLIAGVGRTAQAAGVPAIALAGCVGDGAEATLEVLERYHVVTPEGMPQEEAFARAAELLEEAAAAVIEDYR